MTENVEEGRYFKVGDILHYFNKRGDYRVCSGTVVSISVITDEDGEIIFEFVDFDNGEHYNTDDIMFFFSSSDAIESAKKFCANECLKYEKQLNSILKARDYYYEQLEELLKLR